MRFQSELTQSRRRPSLTTTSYPRARTYHPLPRDSNKPQLSATASPIVYHFTSLPAAGKPYRSRPSEGDSKASICGIPPRYIPVPRTRAHLNFFARFKLSALLLSIAQWDPSPNVPLFTERPRVFHRPAKLFRASGLATKALNFRQPKVTEPRSSRVRI